ncbi:MAG: PaaI family thioesterase, partial [Acidimicrobiia bacterium]
MRLVTDRPTFVAYTGIEVTEATSDRARGRLVITPDHHQPYGLVHGGVYCSIVESVASHGAGQAALAAGQVGVVGISNHTDFLRTHSEGELHI